MILNDEQITKLCEEMGMIAPFHRSGIGSPSFGLSSFGYDVRIRPEVKLFNPLTMGVVDPLAFDPDQLVTVSGYGKSRGYVILPPHSFALAETVESFKIPRDVLVICLGKSTYARCGLIVNVTPLEPEWEGTVTLEISNTTPLPAKIYTDRGIAQMLFLRGEPCAKSYADKKGKYQNQSGITGPK